MQGENQLPQAVVRFLSQFVQQRKWLLFIRELAIFLVVISGWVLLCCLMDRMLVLEAWLRLGLLGLTLLLGSIWLTQLLRRTLLAQVDLNNAALALELLRPDLDERLTTICSGVREHSGVSDEMLAEISRQVERLVEQEGVPRLVSLRGVGRYLACLGLMVVGIGLLSGSSLVGLPQLSLRFLAPWGLTPPVTTTRLLLLQTATGDIHLLQGEGIAVDVLARHVGEEGVTLHFSTDGKTWGQSALSYMGYGHYQGAIGPVNGGQQFYLTSGDARSTLVHVHVRRRPAVAEFRVRYEYPAYIQREPVTVTNTDGLIEAPVGTKATLTVIATEKLRSVTMKAHEGEMALSPTVEGYVMQTEIGRAHV